MGSNTSSYGKGDAAKDTGSSIKEVSGAWHTARDDAVSSGDLSRGTPSGKGGGGFDKESSAGQAASGFWSSIFGK